MNRTLVVISLSLVMIAFASRAHELAALSLTPGDTGRLGQTEENLVNALQSVAWALQAATPLPAQALKALVPEESFTRFAIPFMRIVKDVIHKSKPVSWQLFRFMNSILIAAIEAERWRQ